jgi:hypothetical protein
VAGSGSMAVAVDLDSTAGVLLLVLQAWGGRGWRYQSRWPGLTVGPLLQLHWG